MILLFLLIALMVIYFVANKIFYIACGVIGFLIAIIIYVIISRRRNR